jgi:hypothetical protein
MNILTENKQIKKSNLNYILENMKMAKQYLSQNKLSEEDLESLIKADPTPQKKYVGWMAKQWVNKTVTDLDDLRNYIEEFNTLLNKNKTKTKDIYQTKSFQDLKIEIDQINQQGDNLSLKDLESDYDTVIDNNDLLIMSPYTHEASRKLGLTHFAYRDCGDGKDSTWCTTYKTSSHFDDYYFSNNVTFYYIKIKSDTLMEKIKKAFPKKYKPLQIVALAVLEDGQIDGYDALDKQMNKKEIDTYTKIIGIN